MELAQLADHEEIRQALYRYCRGADRRDEVLLRSAYHPGARDRHGRFDGPAEDFAAYVAGNAKHRSVQHLIGNILIELAGDRAEVESVFIAHLVHDGEDDIELVVLGGRYFDLFERRDGRWAVVDRLVVLDWSERRTGVTEPEIASGFPPGRRDPTDPTYTRYLEASAGRT